MLIGRLPIGSIFELINDYWDEIATACEAGLAMTPHLIRAGQAG